MDAESCFDIVVRGRAPVPEGARALADAVLDWFRARHGPMVVAGRTAADGAGAAAVRLHLHPVDPGVRVHVSAAGEITVRADVFPVGPGYHVFLARALRHLGRDLSIAWEVEPRVGPSEASERAQERLLVEARRVVDELGAEERFPVLMLPRHERFEHNGLIATPLGPRDMRWLASAAVGALRLRDVFPWPEPGLGPRYALGRALTLLWIQVRWRAPAHEADRAALVEVDRLLADAFHGEPNLDLPWAEWAEVRALAGIGGELSEEIRRRGENVDHWPPIGYRRRPVEVRLPAGWWVRVPGEMGTRWEDRETWCADDGERTARFTVVDRRVRVPHPLPRRAMNPDQLVHEGEGWRGAAQLLQDEADPRARVLEGRMVGPESEVRLTAAFSRPADRRWAEGVFRSLRWANPARELPSAPLL